MGGDGQPAVLPGLPRHRVEQRDGAGGSGARGEPARDHQGGPVRAAGIAGRGRIAGRGGPAGQDHLAGDRRGELVGGGDDLEHEPGLRRIRPGRGRSPPVVAGGRAVVAGLTG